VQESAVAKDLEVLGVEKVYQSMKSVGIFNLIIGIALIVFGAVAGSFVIVNGAKLLHRKNDVIF